MFETHLKDSSSHEKFAFLPQGPVLTPFLRLTSRTLSHTKNCLLASRTSPDTIFETHKDDTDTDTDTNTDTDTDTQTLQHSSSTKNLPSCLKDHS